MFWQKSRNKRKCRKFPLFAHWKEHKQLKRGLQTPVGIVRYGVWPAMHSLILSIEIQLFHPLLLHFASFVILPTSSCQHRNTTLPPRVVSSRTKCEQHIISISLVPKWELCQVGFTIIEHWKIFN